VRAALAAIVCALLVTGVCAAAAPDLPSAFTRAPTAADQLPPSVRGVPGEGRPYASRRIASLSGTKRQWSVFIFKQRIKKRINVCLFVSFVFARDPDGVGGAGGGCSPSESFFGPSRDVAASSSRVLAGVASRRVARVVVIGSLGVAHEVPLSRDNGFIFNCRAFNGCACVISRLQAFDKLGNLIENQDWRSSAPNCQKR
jgi:hypothetical protein